jgi:hypothetical protein
MREETCHVLESVRGEGTRGRMERQQQPQKERLNLKDVGLKC